MKTRLIKINDEITRTSAEVIRQELSDPRIGEVVSVIRSDTTADLKTCRIYVSILGGETERKKTMEALQKASGFLRKRIADLINLRQTPELKFVYDDSIEYGMKMRKLIEEVSKGGMNSERDS